MGESPQSEEPPPRYEDIVDEHQELPSGNETLMDEGEDEVGVVKEEEPEEMVCSINLFYYLSSIYSSIPQSIHPFINLFIHSTIYSSISQSIHPFINLFIHSSIYSSISQSIHPFINLFIHFSIYSSIHQSIHSFLNLFIHSF